jgi:hypothetical protein
LCVKYIIASISANNTIIYEDFITIVGLDNVFPNRESCLVRGVIPSVALSHPRKASALSAAEGTPTPPDNLFFLGHPQKPMSISNCKNAIYSSANTLTSETNPCQRKDKARPLPLLQSLRT